jgi:guanylate kinase
MTFAPQFDAIIVNDDLERARKKAETVIREFLSKKA